MPGSAGAQGTVETTRRLAHSTRRRFLQFIAASVSRLAPARNPASALLAALHRLLLGFLFSLCFVVTAPAQSIRITTDNPTDPKRMRDSGTTTLTVALDTNHDRDGSVQMCNSHSSACGASPT